MLVKDIGYELAIRLGDPVSPSAPNESGNVFSEEEKLKYISRAFGKLSRMLGILMRDYQPEFNKTRQFNEFDFGGTPTGTKHSIMLPGTLDIDEIFIHYYLKGVTTMKQAPAVYMEPSKYLSNKYDINDTKSTSFADGKFKYTIMSNVDLGKPILYMLPVPVGDGSYYKLAEILYKPDIINISWDSELPITNQYVDLLIDLATIQGMQDIARADKAQLIERSIAQDWQILGQYGTYMKQTEGVKE